MKTVLIFLLALTPVFVQAQEVNKEPGPDEGKVIFTEEAEQDYEVYTYTEVMPEYKGGMDLFYKYLANNISYPDAALEAGIQGKVFVQFIVQSDGSITAAQVIRGIGGGCDEEALRVTEAMPDWNPGAQRGKAVNVMFRVPIQFRLPAPIAE